MKSNYNIISYIIIKSVLIFAVFFFNYLFDVFYLLYLYGIVIYRCLEINKPKISQKSTNLSATGTTIKKRKTATVHKCIYNNKENIQTLAEEVILEIRDIEEIITRGHKLTACPYYASRQSMQFSQVTSITLYKT